MGKCPFLVNYEETSKYTSEKGAIINKVASFGNCIMHECVAYRSDYDIKCRMMR